MTRGDPCRTRVKSDWIILLLVYTGGRDIDDVQFLFRDEEMLLFR